MTSSPMKLLRTFPRLNSHKIISKTLSILPQLPDYLYDLLVRHPYDPTLDASMEELDDEALDSGSESEKDIITFPNDLI